MFFSPQYCALPIKITNLNEFIFGWFGWRVPFSALYKLINDKQRTLHLPLKWKHLQGVDWSNWLNVYSIFIPNLKYNILSCREVTGHGVQLCGILLDGAADSEVTCAFINFLSICKHEPCFSLCSAHSALTDLNSSSFRLGVPSFVIESSSKFFCLPPPPYSSFLRQGEQLSYFFKVGERRGSVRRGRQHWPEAFTVTKQQ